MQNAWSGGSVGLLVSLLSLLAPFGAGLPAGDGFGAGVQEADLWKAAHNQHRPGDPYDPDVTLRQLVAGGVLPDLRWPNFSGYRDHVIQFYEPAGYSLAWIQSGEPTRQALDIIAILQNSSVKGLNPDDYDGPQWPGRLARLSPSTPQPSESDMIRFDLAITVSVMRYVSDLCIGRVNPRLLCFDYDVNQKKCDLAGLLRRELVYAKDTRAVLEQVEPPFDAYRRIERALETYLVLAREDDGKLLPGTKKPVELGDSYPGVPRLIQLLRRLGDLQPGAKVDPASTIYDRPLVDAVKHFQERHGLDPDGRIGDSTLRQLNTPLSQRVRQLQLALERWRWVRDEFSRPPIVINIPEFRLRALSDRYETDLEMKVIVGGAYRHQTPVFTTDMTHVIFQPYWNVPLSIQRAELVPKLKKDPAFLGKDGFEVVDSSDGVVARESVTGEMLDQLRSGKLTMRQVPGAKNALGHIKFVFPNAYDVYLHDTPTQALFAKSRRDFSHGCIRIEKPDELAAWVLRDKPEWTLDRIREAKRRARPLQVNLDRPIPVLIFYGTAVVGENGEVCFFDDIYGHDASLQQVLDRGYPYSDGQPTSAERVRRQRE